MKPPIDVDRYLKTRALIKMNAGPGAVLFGPRLVLFNSLVLVIFCVTPYAVLSLLLNSA